MPWKEPDLYLKPSATPLPTIVFVPHPPRMFDAEKSEHGEHMVRPRSLLNNHFVEFRNYLQSVQLDMGVTQKGPGDQLPLRIFEIPRNHQRHVMEARRLTEQKVRLVAPDLPASTVRQRSLAHRGDPTCRGRLQCQMVRNKPTHMKGRLEIRLANQHASWCLLKLPVV